ncbi:hypothetical protein V8C35DRAFT_263818 [Trichoderma chlorosporum]
MYTKKPAIQPGNSHLFSCLVLRAVLFISFFGGISSIFRSLTLSLPCCTVRYVPWGMPATHPLSCPVLVIVFPFFSPPLPPLPHSSSPLGTSRRAGRAEKDRVQCVSSALIGGKGGRPNRYGGKGGGGFGGPGFVHVIAVAFFFGAFVFFMGGFSRQLEQR